jgi:hypothetical protein
MKRRHILKSLPCILGTSTFFRPLVQAKELTGKWTKEWIVKYSMSLVDWVKEDVSKRANTLKDLAELDVALGYQFFNDPLDKKKQTYQDRFLAARLSDKDTADHIKGFLEDIEAVRVAVAAKEAEAVKTWKDETAGDLPVKEGKIYDSTIITRNLGVILDKSYSMTHYLEKLRTEIGRDFAGCHIVEVDGCEMWEGGGRYAWFHAVPARGINPFTPDRYIPSIPQSEAHIAWMEWTQDTQSAFYAMVELMKMDSIYWFCDFDDEIFESEFSRIAKSILDHKVKLFVHTLSKSPPKFVSTLVEQSGGKVIKKRIR